MADLISRNALVTKLSKGYWDRELQQAKNDPCVIDAMIDWAIRIVKEMPLESPWHTGTPTEEGFWLVKYKCVVEGKYNGRLTYRAVKIEKDKIDGFAYESGGIGAEEYWKPIEYQKIDDLWRGEK